MQSVSIGTRNREWWSAWRSQVQLILEIFHTQKSLSHQLHGKQNLKSPKGFQFHFGLQDTTRIRSWCLHMRHFEQITNEEHRCLAIPLQDPEKTRELLFIWFSWTEGIWLKVLLVLTTWKSLCSNFRLLQVSQTFRELTSQLRWPDIYRQWEFVLFLSINSAITFKIHLNQDVWFIRI
jgi:hypothetical protein